MGRIRKRRVTEGVGFEVLKACIKSLHSQVPLIPALGRQRQVDLCEFKASMVYES